MEEVCYEEEKLKSKVKIRWEKEMEDDDGKFKWDLWKKEG